MDVTWTEVVLRRNRVVDPTDVFLQMKSDEMAQAVEARAQMLPPAESVYLAEDGYKGAHFDHFMHFFRGVREGTPVIEDANFGLRAAALSGLAPSGFLLGRGGKKAFEEGYKQSLGILNRGHIRMACLPKHLLGGRSYEAPDPHSILSSSVFLGAYGVGRPSGFPPSLDASNRYYAASRFVRASSEGGGTMVVVFVHGWSVTDTSTYGRLPEALATQAGDYGLDVRIEHVWLGRYISFHDGVTVADVARAFDRALRDQIPEGGGIAEFSCITHSTGGPVVREWLEQFCGTKPLSESPLRHLVMLAPANHGSALAALGKSRVGRIKAAFSGVEPGQRILDWLSLASQEQIDLAAAFIDYEPAKNRFFPFVLTGQAIDDKFYDFINSYLVEAGSDGVVRVAAANLNYSMIKLVEAKRSKEVKHGGATPFRVRLLKVEGKLKRPLRVALGVIHGASHSGTKKGIMGAVRTPTSNRPQVAEILKCLQVRQKRGYDARAAELEELTKQTQKSHRYMMLVFVVKDDQGTPVNDFDLFLLGGDSHSPDKLTKGFFVDRQQNATHRNHLVYYIDYDIIIKNQLSGFRVIARPSQGFTYYSPVEYHSPDRLNALLRPNEVFYVEIELRRCIDRNVFRFDNAEAPKLRKKSRFSKSETRHSFKDEKPTGGPVDE